MTYFLLLFRKLQFHVLFCVSIFGSMTGCASNGILPGIGAAENVAAGSSENPVSNSDVRGTQASNALIQPSEFTIDSSDTPEALTFEVRDVIEVTIWGYPELGHIAEIQPNGTITLPLIGEIPAAGLTVEELRQSIEERLQPYGEIVNQELRQGDSLSLRVWQHPDLSEDSIIEPSGMATLPLVGRITAANRTVEEVTAEATEGVREFIRDAQVTVIPTFSDRRTLRDYEVSVLAQQLAPRQVAVIGEVGNQNLMPINGTLRLIEALAMSQVSQNTAALNSIVVIRDTYTSQPQYQQFRIADFLEGKAPDQNIFLRNGDIVVVPQTTIARVGTFVDQFFARTLPIFNFWNAIFSSSVAQESADTVRLINESLRRGLLDISPQL